MTDKYIMINEKKFHYLQWGNNTSPTTIVLLHGLNQSAHSWDEFCQAASSQYQLIALDQRGHGESYQSPEGDYSRESMVQDLEDITRKLNLHKFFLIGMSMGGANSTYFTVKKPSAVKALVLVDWLPIIDQREANNIRAIAQMEWTSFEEAVNFIHKINPQRTRQNIENRLRYTIHQKEANKWTWRFDGKGWFKKYESSKEPNSVVWNHLKSVACPTLLIKGQKSELTHLEVAQQLAREMKNLTLRVVDAGHSVAGDNPQAFYDEVTTFFSNVQKNESKL